MRSARLFIVVAAGAALAVGGCGAGGGESPDGGSASPPATAPSPSESPSPSPTGDAAAPTGTLASTPVTCTDLELPAGLAPANAGPTVMCAYESKTDYVSFTVDARSPRTFDAARTVEQARSNGRIVIEPAPADGWTFGARWPADGPLVRVQKWLVDGRNQVLLCKMGSERGEPGIQELAAVCERAKSALYTE